MFLLAWSWSTKTKCLDIANRTFWFRLKHFYHFYVFCCRLFVSKITPKVINWWCSGLPSGSRTFLKDSCHAWPRERAAWRRSAFSECFSSCICQHFWLQYQQFCSQTNYAFCHNNDPKVTAYCYTEYFLSKYVEVSMVLFPSVFHLHILSG